MTITSPDAPTQGTQISSTLPANIPAPKFHLFQKVLTSDEKRLGIITGMEFVTLETALLKCIIGFSRGFGWKYIVNYVYAASPEEVIEFEDDPVDGYWECGLESVVGCQVLLPVGDNYFSGLRTGMG